MVTTTIHGFRRFAHGHDDIPAFHAAYLVATFLAAAVLNLGFFLGLILFHMSLDYVKYRDVHRYGYKKTLHAMVLENISDIALFLTALTVAVYFSHTFFLAAASGLLRTGMTLLKAVGTLIPKVAILERFTMIALNLQSYMHAEAEGLHSPMKRVQLWSYRVAGLCVLLLVAAVGLYAHHSADLMDVLLRQLIPSF